MRKILPLLAIGAAIAAGIGSTVTAAVPRRLVPQAPPEVRADAREIFAHIVGIESSIGKGNVPLVATYLAERFKDAGFPAEDIHIVPLGETASLVVRYRGAEQRASSLRGKPIAFVAHMDVVTAKRSEWERDPYTFTEENGFFFGRGTSDVKQEVALLTATFRRLKAEHYVPSRDLIIAFTGDEETEGATADDLVRHHRDLLDAEYAVNGDGGGGVLSETSGAPILFYVQGAEKSSAQFLLTTHNAGGHSSEPRADNAIYELADALKAVQRLEFPVMWNEWTIGDLRAAAGVVAPPLGTVLGRFAADPHDAGAAAEISLDPGYVGRLRTTCVATLLEGGHAPNALPQTATSTVNCRIFPGMSGAEVQQLLRQAVGPNVGVKPDSPVTVSDASPMRADLMRAIKHAVDVSAPGALVVPTQAAYATDGAFYRNGGLPTYGAGGVFIKGSEMFSHGLNERVRVDAFYDALTYWDVLIKDLAASK